MTAILGFAGSTIVKNLSLDVIPEFIFKDDVESSNFLPSLWRDAPFLGRRSSIPPQLQELILTDLVSLALLCGSIGRIRTFIHY